VTINRLQTLAQHAVYEPARGMENSPEMEMLRPGVCEVALRFVEGTRTFAAVSGDGVVRHLGIMEQGGDEEAVLDELERRLIEGHVRERILRVV
jgi:hypothetical protein